MVAIFSTPQMKPSAETYGAVLHTDASANQAPECITASCVTLSTKQLHYWAINRPSLGHMGCREWKTSPGYGKECMWHGRGQSRYVGTEDGEDRHTSVSGSWRKNRTPESEKTVLESRNPAWSLCPLLSARSSESQQTTFYSCASSVPSTHSC